MIDFPRRVIEILRSSPNGLTSKEVAARLGTNPINMSSRLSKLAAYGLIGKAQDNLVNRGTKGTVYQVLSHQLAPSDST